MLFKKTLKESIILLKFRSILEIFLGFWDPFLITIPILGQELTFSRADCFRWCERVFVQWC